MFATNSELSTLRMFFRSFCVSRFYDLGFSDAVVGCGADRAENVADMHRALAYMTGYANCARIANVYMSTSWQVADLLGTACGVLLTVMTCDDLTKRSIEGLCAQYARELQALAIKAA